MRRAIAFLGLALLAAGCGGGKPAAGSVAATGKPAADDAKACIVTYLGECGWRDVQITQLADQADVPGAAKVTGEAWAFTFSASYTNVFGERMTSDNWVAVVTRADGKPCVKSCFDEARRMVGGHSGEEEAEKGVLSPLPPTPEAPAIVPPKP